jgi:hypothetical protein
VRRRTLITLAVATALLTAGASSAYATLRGVGTLTPTTGKLYTVPIQADGDPGPLTQLWESGPADPLETGKAGAPVHVPAAPSPPSLEH